MILDLLLEKYKGYTPDFYFCVLEKIKEMHLETAVAICERLYG